MISRPMLSYHALHHVPKLQLMRGYLIELILLYHSQNQVLVCLEQLVDVEPSDLWEECEPLHVHPLENGFVHFIGVHFVRQMPMRIEVVLLFFVDNHRWQFLKVKVLGSDILAGGIENPCSW